jgi:hypothetical protein
MGQSHTTFDVARSGAQGDPLHNTFHHTHFFTGLYFEVDHNHDDILLNAYQNPVSASDLLQAAAHMVARMQDELWGYLGIAANAEIVSLSGSSRMTVTPCAHDPAAAWRTAVGAGTVFCVQLVPQEGSMAEAMNAAMRRFTSDPANRLGDPVFDAYLRDLWLPARQRMLALLHDVTVGLAVWGRPPPLTGPVVYERNITEAVDVINNALTRPGLEYEIWMNPFAWFALDRGIWRYNFDTSSARAAAACGPTMMLLHETDHASGYITAAHPTGDPVGGEEGGEEQGVVVEIDLIMAKHPDVAPRYRYPNYPKRPGTDDPHDHQGTGHGDRSDLCETLPGDIYVLDPVRDRRLGETTEELTARHKEWVRWASRSQLLTGHP